MSHTVALGDVLLHYNQHGHCGVFFEEIPQTRILAVNTH